jgi:hypothetical protein
MTVSDLLEQPCNKSDNAIKLVTSCQQLVPNLLQQLGTSSANTTCRQLVNRFVITCLQTCNSLYAQVVTNLQQIGSNECCSNNLSNKMCSHCLKRSQLVDTRLLCSTDLLQVFPTTYYRPAALAIQQFVNKLQETTL